MALSLLLKRTISAKEKSIENQELEITYFN